MQSEITAEIFQPPSHVEGAIADVYDGLSKTWMWSAMATQDIKLRYRGSVLGPFWLTLSMLIMVAAMGLIYARLFGTEASRYLPFLTVGLVLWQFISATITEGCQYFPVRAANHSAGVSAFFSVRMADGVPKLDRLVALRRHSSIRVHLLSDPN